VDDGGGATPASGGGRDSDSDVLSVELLPDDPEQRGQVLGGGLPDEIEVQPRAPVRGDIADAVYRPPADLGMAPSGRRTERFPSSSAQFPSSVTSGPLSAVRALLTEERRSRDRSAVASRRTAVGFPTGKTFTLRSAYDERNRSTARTPESRAPSMKPKNAGLMCSPAKMSRVVLCAALASFSTVVTCPGPGQE
jgi:hypothetical protein